MSEQALEREKLRLDLETFLREKYQLPETYEAEREQWDAREVASMGFRAPWGELMRHAPLSDFEAWRERRQS